MPSLAHDSAICDTAGTIVLALSTGSTASVRGFSPSLRGTAMRKYMATRRRLLSLAARVRGLKENRHLLDRADAELDGHAEREGDVVPPPQPVRDERPDHDDGHAEHKPAE